MSAQPRRIEEKPETKLDLIDRIAEALPEAVRADYYREMSHCRALPESDEMLRILRAMQFLTVLIEQAPERIASEREKLAAMLAGSLETIRATHAANVAYQKQIEQRLVKLPAEVAAGIEPGAIAAKISESLRQQFQQTGIPETVAALKTVSRDIKEKSTEISDSAAKLKSAVTNCEGSERNAREKAKELVSRIVTAGQAADQVNEKMRANFLPWAFMAFFIAVGLGAGFFMAFLYRAPVMTDLQQLDREIKSREERLERTPDLRQLPDKSWVVRIEKNGLLTDKEGQTFARLPRK